MPDRAALACRPLDRAREAPPRHLLEDVVADSPVGDRAPAAPAGGAHVVVLVVVEIPCDTGLVL
jgi:hypothetical protein